MHKITKWKFLVCNKNMGLCLYMQVYYRQGIRLAPRTPWYRKKIPRNNSWIKLIKSQSYTLSAEWGVDFMKNCDKISFLFDNFFSIKLTILQHSTILKLLKVIQTDTLVRVVKFGMTRVFTKLFLKWPWIVIPLQRGLVFTIITIAC